MVHLAWDVMIGLGTALLFLAIWFAVLWWRRRAGIATSTWFLRAAAIAPIGAYLALESGWIATEVGRQPWVVYEILRTAGRGHRRPRRPRVDLVPRRSSCSTPLLAVASVLVIRAMTRRWRDGEVDDSAVPYGPREGVPPLAPGPGAAP